MGRQDYPNEVTTTIPSGTPDELQLVVLRELLAWCEKRCSGRYRLTTTRREGRSGTWLAMQFEDREDAAQLEAAFSRQDGK